MFCRILLQLLLIVVECCIICTNFSTESKLALTLLYFVQVFGTDRFYWAVLLHFLQDFSKNVPGWEHAAYTSSQQRPLYSVLRIYLAHVQ